MAYRVKKQWIWVIAWALLTISLRVSAGWEPVILNQHPIKMDAAWDMAPGEHSFWFAYYGSDNRLYVRRPNGVELGFGATDRQMAQSGLAMTVANDRLSVLWRDKLPEKTLYFLPRLAAEGDAPNPAIIGGPESEALTRFKIAQQGNTAYFLWLGEKGSEPKAFKPGQKSGTKEYHLYFRYTEDDGKTLSPVEKVVSGFYPAWIVGREQISVFSWTMMDGKLAMAMRVFDCTKKTFGPQVKITDAPEIGPIFEAFESSGRWFLMWVGHYSDTKNEFELLLEGVYSDDKGQTWKRFNFEPLRGLDIGGNLNVAADNKGHILLAVSGSWRERDPKAKRDVYLLRSDDNGSTWSAPYQPRSVESRITHGRFPAVIMGPKEGSALLLWEDWRDIRPNIYISTSMDFGANWSDPIPVGRPGFDRLGLEFQTRVIGVIDNRYHLLAKRYNDDFLKDNVQAVLYTFTWDELQQRAKDLQGAMAQPNMGEARLRERIARYWQAMVDGQYEITYATQDPFFRNGPSYKAYRERMGIIKYHGYQITEVKFLSKNLAKVSMQIDSSVPEFKPSNNAKIYSRPKQTYNFTETWIYVDGDWYHEYYDEFNERRYTKY